MSFKGVVVASAVGIAFMTLAWVLRALVQSDWSIPVTWPILVLIGVFSACGVLQFYKYGKESRDD